MGTNIAARRKLSELYVRGVEIRFDQSGATTGPFDEPAGEGVIAIWVQPPGPLQREMALRDANASRAKAMVRLKKDPESEEALTTAAFLSQMSDDTLIECLLEYESESRRADAIRHVLAQDEWSDFTALQDAMRQYETGELETSEDDPEYVALMKADDLYGEQVAARMDELYEADRESFAMFPRANLEKRGAEKRSDLMGSQVFMTEYERQMTFYGVRDPDDHGVLFFESARELADQEEIVRSAIVEALTHFLNEVGDVKNSPRVADGSQQSAPPSEPETSEASIPEELTA